MNEDNETPAPQTHERHSTHHVHRGPESLPCYCAASSDHSIGQEQSHPPAPQSRSVPPRWRVFEDVMNGWLGIEEDIFDGNTILYPKKMNRDPLDGVVRAHNAALSATTEGSADA